MGKLMIKDLNDDLFKKEPRIYHLMDGDVVVYVGQSISLASRVSGHFSTDKIFDSVVFRDVDEKDLSAEEADDIVKFNPKYNTYLPKCDKHCGYKYIKDVAGIYFDIVKEKLDCVFERENRAGIISRYFLKDDVDKFVFDIDNVISEYSLRWNKDHHKK